MFEAYKPFVGAKNPPNRFWPVPMSEIESAEARLGYSLPTELRTFYIEVGYGFYGQGAEDLKRTHVNRVVGPRSIASLVLDASDPYRPQEGFSPGVLPFFDLGEATYLVLLPASKAPNAVYWPDGRTRISESLTEFFSSLYLKAGFYKNHR